MDSFREPDSPWHAGEKQLQQLYNAAERMEELGRRVIRDYMPDQHRAFYHQLPFMVVGAVDPQGRPWATLLEGPEGFVTSADSHHLHLATRLAPQDPATPGLQAGQAVGMLGIELDTRRRNRVNGVIQRASASGLEVAVEQSYGNCPKYIQDRVYIRPPEGPGTPPPAEHASELNAHSSAMILEADTFFIASFVDHEDRRAVDVSHRGGRAGFIRLEGNRLTVPDYTGNLFFNTLGNLQANPVAGLLFIDFDSGDLLQLTGRTELLLDSPLIKAFEGAERLWAFEVEQVVFRPAAVGLRWLFHEYAPTSLATGTWAETDARLQQQAQRGQWQQWRVARAENESSDIRSLYLEPPGNTAIPFTPGQHLPMRILTDEGPLIRTYSLSSAPEDGYLRISVKRQGPASCHLHGRLQVGDVVEVRPPVGSFSLVEGSERPVVLLGAGVGITPLLSMARALVAQNRLRQTARPVHLFQSARSLDELPFQAELATLQQHSGGLLHIHRTLSKPGALAVLDRDYQLEGRLEFAQVKARLPLDDYDFYLCGPGGFLQTMYDGLRSLNIQDARIHAEAFGPSALRRSAAEAPPPLAQPPVASEPVPVYFKASASEARWLPGGGSLLELAESSGLNPEFSCRGGSCGTCAAGLVSGQVSYPTPPAQLPPAGQVLICCAVPAQPEGTGQPLVLDL